MTKFIVTGGGGDGTLFHFINVVPFFFDQDGFRQFPLKFVGLYVAIDLGGRVLHGGGQSRHEPVTFQSGGKTPAMSKTHSILRKMITYAVHNRVNLSSTNSLLPPSLI